MVVRETFRCLNSRPGWLLKGSVDPYYNVLTLTAVPYTRGCVFFFPWGGGGGKGKVGCLSTVFEGKFLLSIMCAWIVKTVICCFSKKRPFT